MKKSFLNSRIGNTGILAIALLLLIVSSSSCAIFEKKEI